MAHARSVLTALAAACLAGCGALPESPSGAPSQLAAAPVVRPFEPTYHFPSKRHSLDLPLPGKEWRIDDRTTSFLLASHKHKSARVWVKTWRPMTARASYVACKAETDPAFFPSGVSTVLREEIMAERPHVDTRVTLFLRDTDGRMNGELVAVGAVHKVCFVYRAMVHDASNALVGEMLGELYERSLKGIVFEEAPLPQPFPPKI